MTPAIGTEAPAFTLPSTEGKPLSLLDLRGKKIVLYFYPKDDTPGCTVEACDFRDNLERVHGAGAEVLGISKDSLISHERFRNKHGLAFPLLTDEGNVVAKAYGAYGKKLMYGRPVEGTIRTTVLIGKDGKVEQVWSPVRVAGHIDQVLAALHGTPAAASASVPAPPAPASSPAPAPAPEAAAPVAAPAAAPPPLMALVKPLAPKQPAAKKAVAKPAAKNAAAKPAAKKAAAKPAAKKAVAKPAAKKGAAKKPAAKKAAAKKVAKKPAAKKAVQGRKR